MLRRLGIAQAVVHDPQFIILDELTVGLDPRQRIGIRDNVQRLASDKVVLHSTAPRRGRACAGGPVLILRDGQLALDGTVAEIETSSGIVGGGGLERGIGAIIVQHR
jgi:ABC-2 type transport system ATP-binding protein